MWFKDNPYRLVGGSALEEVFVRGHELWVDEGRRRARVVLEVDVLGLGAPRRSLPAIPNAQGDGACAHAGGLWR